MNDKKEYMIRIRLTKTQMEHLHRVHDKTGLPISKIVRELVHNDIELSK